jgi:cytochrome c oxidase accessory protein FixG
MVWYLAVPFLRMNGKPLILLDFPRRHFTLFGTTFLPTDTLLLMLLAVSGVIGIFLLTAIAGRAWCGWACPQTVWMEFLFRPIERFFEGGERGSARMDAEKGTVHWRRVAKNLTFLAMAVVMGNVFLAYFIGTETLEQWMQRSPLDHPQSFVVMAIFTALVYFDYAYFREQTCLVACPYGRWQSALLDKQSLIVAYDAKRGEPRGAGKTRDNLGSCVSCNACVAVCPTGIDIRNGLQMECIHCTQCADACDQIMDKVGQPRGLIRYTTRATLEGETRRLVRPRTVLYPTAFALFFGGFLFALGTKDKADVTLLGVMGSAPFTIEANGRVVNQVRIKITDRSSEPRAYRITLLDADDATMIAPQNPLPVQPGQTELESIFIQSLPTAYKNGVRTVRIRIDDASDFSAEYPYRLVGPSAPAGAKP